MKNFFLLTIFITLTICAKAQKRWNFELGAGMTQNSGNVENISLKNYAELERNDSLISCNFNYKFFYQKEN